MANFAGSAVDFLEKINPEGGRESTGLVTRFTMDRPENLPAGFPIQIRLLGEMDIAKILINSYANDVLHIDEEDEKDHNPEQIMGTLTGLRANMAEQPLGQVSEEDIFDLEDYCNSRLIGSPRIKALRRIGFWDQAAEVVPRLRPEDRQVFFSVVWDNMEVFTNIYKRLQSTLIALGAEDLAYCTMEGLFAGEGDSLDYHPNSIIAVSTLDEFNRSAAGSSDTVRIRTDREGREVAIARSELTALIAELRIVMEEQPDDFFDYTDLLDFPGARTRNPLHKDKIDAEAGTSSEFLLRGKVAYLFDRYNAEQELTSMLLCGDHNNNEVEGIDELVFSWISATHGETAEQRSGRQTALFFVLTKFDNCFSESVGKTNPFPNRMFNSLLEKYDHRHSWPTQWDDKGPFRGCFAIRNPKFKQDQIFEYAGKDKADGELYYQETAVRDDKQQLIGELHDLFLNCEEVTQHFREPEQAWSALMTLNDGGIGYLVDNLKPVCNPDIKRKQVEARLSRLCESVLGRLQGYHISGDQDEELRKKESMVQDIWGMLAPIIEDRHFGEFLECLQVPEQDVHGLYFAARSLPETDDQSAEDDGPAPVRPSAATSSVLKDLGGMFGDDDTASNLDPVEEAPAPPIAAHDFADRFAGKVEEYWAARMRELREQAELLRYFRLDADLYGKLVDELLVGSRRRGLFDQVSEDVRQFGQFKETSSIWKDVTAVCVPLNDYVAYLGLGGGAEPGGTPIERNGTVVGHVFKPPEPVNEYPEVNPTDTAYDMQYYKDWLAAFRQLVTDNVKYQAGVAGSLEENARLGRVLNALQLPPS
jgi:hypothetical protein